MGKQGLLMPISLDLATRKSELLLCHAENFREFAAQNNYVQIEINSSPDEQRRGIVSFLEPVGMD